MTQINDENQSASDESSLTPLKNPVESTGTDWQKFKYVLLAVGGVSLGLICGGAYYMYSHSHTRTTAPAEVIAMQREIVEIVLPPHLQPSYGVSLNSYLGLIPMKMVVYNQGSTANLLLMQMHEPGNEDEEIRIAFAEVAEQQQNSQFQIASRQTRSISVDGGAWDFHIDTGTANHLCGRPIPVRMMTGIFRSKQMLTAMFPSKKTVGYIRYTIDEAAYDEAAVIKMLESIHR